jgi:RNA polymerase sigma-70 factor (ECF subfamily)
MPFETTIAVFPLSRRGIPNTNMVALDPDAELLARIAAGETRALTELYALYGARLHAFALRLTGSSPAAEDVLQECLVEIWRSARRFRGEGRAVAWMLGIAHHKAMDVLRARKDCAPAAALDDRLAEGPSVEQKLILSENARDLRQGLDRLSLPHRAAVELVFFQGLSLRETSRALGCPVGTVKSRLNTAKNELRSILRDLGHEKGDRP